MPACRFALGSSVAVGFARDTVAASGVVWPCWTKVKVLVVSVAGSIASEKVALGETSSATPVSPTTGVVALIVGGVVSLPHSMRASAQSAWSEEMPSPASVTTSRSSLAPAIETSTSFVAVVPVIAAAVVDLAGVRVHLEDDRAAASDLVVDADARLEAGAGPLQGIAHVGVGMRAEALGVGRAVQGDRVSVGRVRLAVRAVELDRPVAVGHDRVVQVAQVCALWRLRRRRGDLADRAAVEVGVVEVAVGAELEIDGVGSARNEGVDLPGVGDRITALLHHPDAIARVVGEEERALVRGRIAGSGGCELEGEPRDRGAPGGTRLAGDDLVCVVVGEEGLGVGRRLVVQVLADLGWPRRSPTGAECPRSRASRSSRPSRRWVEDAVDLLPVVQPTSPSQSSFVPGRKVKRKGLRRP